MARGRAHHHGARHAEADDAETDRALRHDRDCSAARIAAQMAGGVAGMSTWSMP
jgi:hypothetical protein